MHEYFIHGRTIVVEYSSSDDSADILCIMQKREYHSDGDGLCLIFECPCLENWFSGMSFEFEYRLNNSLEETLDVVMKECTLLRCMYVYDGMNHGNLYEFDDEVNGAREQIWIDGEIYEMKDDMAYHETIMMLKLKHHEMRFLDRSVIKYFQRNV